MLEATTVRLGETPDIVDVAAALRELRDDEAAWTAMAGLVRALRDPDGHRVPILVDLPGPSTDAGVTARDAILARMATHRHKETSLLRQLRSWSAGAPD